MKVYRKFRIVLEITTQKPHSENSICLATQSACHFLPPQDGKIYVYPLEEGTDAEPVGMFGLSELRGLS